MAGDREERHARLRAIAAKDGDETEGERQQMANDLLEEAIEASDALQNLNYLLSALLERLNR